MVLDYTFERQLMLERKDRLAEGLVEGRAEGLEKGLAEGLEKGLAQGYSHGYMVHLIEQVSKKYVKGLMIEDTADILEERVELIADIYSAIETTKEKDVDEIFHTLQNIMNEK